MKKALMMFMASLIVLAALGTVSGCGEKEKEKDMTAYPFYEEDPAYTFSVSEERQYDESTKQYRWADGLCSMLHPFWQGNVVYNETVMLVDDGGVISGKLMYEPTKILSVRDYAWEKEYEEGKDYTVEGNTIVRTAESDIPYLAAENFRGENLPEGYRLVQSIANVETDVVLMGATIYTEGSLIYGHQVSVSYVYDCTREDTGAFAQYDAGMAPQFQAKFAEGKDLKLGIIGDSVAEGCSSSSKFNREPYLPNFIDMTALYMNALYARDGKGGAITVENYAKGGMTSEWGAAQEQINRIIAGAPDVLFVHFGINDNGSDFSKGTYHDNIESLVLKVREALPSCEVVLIKAFTPEPMTYNDSLFEGYWKGLDSIAEMEGVYVLDLYTPSLTMLQTKKYMDVTGNGINHLNDFTARVYVMNILASMVLNNG